MNRRHVRRARAKQRQAPPAPKSNPHASAHFSCRRSGTSLARSLALLSFSLDAEQIRAQIT